MVLKDHFMPQKMMRKVIYALSPLLLFSIWMYGWRVLLLLAVVSIFGVGAEYFIMRSIQGEKVKVTESVLVTCLLFTLTLPPATPFYVAVIGILVGVIFGKGVFGGFGRNIFNPALVGRCFIYVCFPRHLTMRWTEPFLSFPGGFAAFDGGVDAITSSTPMIAMEAGEAAPDLGTLILGTHAGSMGETMVILILLAAVYLALTKTASWEIMVASMGSGLIFTSIFKLAGANVPPIHAAVLTGGLLFASVFMATDPVSAPKEDESKWIVGALIGLFSATIRVFGLFTEGAMFAILIANALTPLIDRSIKELKAQAKAKVEKEAEV